MRYVKTKILDRILILTINREDKLNALNAQIIKELDEVLSSSISNNSISCIVITGYGNKSFVAGADISEMIKFDNSKAANYSNDGINLFNKIETSPKPIIAAVNGYALGGGCELALACHIRYSSKNALFGLPEVSLGLIPGWGGTQRLKKIVGPGIANELIFSAKHIDANRALEIRLVNRLCKDVLEDSINLANTISKNSSLAISHAMKSMRLGENVPYFDSFDIENNFFSSLFGSHDSKEGMKAFLEKRKANFRGN